MFHCTWHHNPNVWGKSIGRSMDKGATSRLIFDDMRDFNGLSQHHTFTDCPSNYWKRTACQSSDTSVDYQQLSPLDGSVCDSWRPDGWLVWASTFLLSWNDRLCMCFYFGRVGASRVVACDESCNSRDGRSDDVSSSHVYFNSCLSLETTW